MPIAPLAALAALAAAAAPIPAAAQDRPNIVLIIADDMAWNDCGAYGHPSIRTPHIDALAEQGMRFDRAFLTCSSCSPSRSSLITGRYPHATGAEELHWPLPEGQVTFVERLREAGYWTAAAGKWHLGSAVKDRFDQVREGDARGFQLPSGAHDDAAELGFDADAAAQAGTKHWVPVLRDRPRDKPFFLWLAAIDPHRDYRDGTLPEPHRPDDARVPPYLPDTPEVRADLARYYDEIGRLDFYIGAVLDELDAQGVADETLVVFMSDNGRPFPRCKTTVFDSGIRTPLIARWPGAIEPGSTCEEMISSVDLAPTFLSLAGVPAPATFQGVDASGLLRAPATPVRDAAFAEHNWHDYAAYKRSVRTKQYKYIRNGDFEMPLTPPADAVRSPTFEVMQRLRDRGELPTAQMGCFMAPRPVEELYDLADDPHELRNLAEDPSYATVLEAMRAQLAGWVDRTADRPGAVLSPDEFDRETGLPLPNRERPRRPGPFQRLTSR